MVSALSCLPHIADAPSFTPQLFFDDEHRNFEVESLGVTMQLVPSSGTDRALWAEGLGTWRKRRGIRIGEGGGVQGEGEGGRPGVAGEVQGEGEGVMREDD